MGLITATPKIQIKRTDTPGVVPTLPISNDHTDGSWLITDIYSGEFFLNTADNKLFTRTNTGILQVYPQDSGTTYQDVFEYSASTAFPTTGQQEKLYVATDNNLLYRYDPAMFMYIQIASLSGSTYWASIIDSPASVPAQIDNAVAIAHNINDVNTSHYTKIESDGPATLTGGTGAKVDKIIGKDLSTYDFNDYYRTLLTGYTESVQEYIDQVALPTSGTTNTLYITTTDDKLWYWDSATYSYIDLFTTLPNWHIQNTDTGTTNSSFTINSLISLSPNGNTLDIIDSNTSTYGNLYVNDLNALGEVRIGNTGQTTTTYYLDTIFGTGAIRYVGATGSTRSMDFSLDLSTWTPLGFGTLLIDDLQDVTITTPATNDVLTYVGGSWINKQPLLGSVKYVPSGVTYTIDSNFQNLVYGDLTVAGEIVNNGNITIINGSVVLLGTGVISGAGAVDLIILT